MGVDLFYAPVLTASPASHSVPTASRINVGIENGCLSLALKVCDTVDQSKAPLMGAREA
jgi:hypothetical protein